MPTLYTLKEKNVQRTWFLMTLFLVIIIALGWVISYQFDSPIILVVAVFFSTFMSFTSYWYSDKIVLALSGAKEVNHEENPRVYHLVENLCIAAGLPFPKIYIIDDPAPNAFATGRDPQHAVIALTSGLLQKMEKTELEGVISHELSHIGNRDILLQTVVVVLVGFVVLISDWFLRSWRWSGGRRDNDRGSFAAIFALIGIILAILAPLFVNLIQLAISRKREFLADASGALLTRYPEGLARALEKISQDQNQLRTANQATAHLFIVNPFKGKKISTLFMTHPPIEQRIRALRDLKI